MGKGKWFFGWTNIKWFITEMVNIYTARKTYFSKKRIESGIGFVIAEWGMIFYLLAKINTMSMIDFGMWATIQFFIAGYIIRQIQKEKVDSINTDDNSSEESEQ
jgi:hypothetical protein